MRFQMGGSSTCYPAPVAFNFPVSCIDPKWVALDGCLNNKLLAWKEQRALDKGASDQPPRKKCEGLRLHSGCRFMSFPISVSHDVLHLVLVPSFSLSSIVCWRTPLFGHWPKGVPLYCLGLLPLSLENSREAQSPHCTKRCQGVHQTP